MLVYISNGKLFQIKSGKPAEIKCGFINKYITNLEDIRKKKEWKSTGSGARFMGVMLSGDDQEDNIQVSGISLVIPINLS